MCLLSYKKLRCDHLIVRYVIPSINMIKQQAEWGQTFRNIPPVEIYAYKCIHGFATYNMLASENIWTYNG